MQTYLPANLFQLPFKDASQHTNSVANPKPKKKKPQKNTPLKSVTFRSDKGQIKSFTLQIVLNPKKNRKD